MIIKKAQFNFVDVWDESVEGWQENHTRVQIKKTPKGKRVFYVSGKPLPKIKLIEISKSC